MSQTNQELAAQILMTDPETDEELCPCAAPEAVDGVLVLLVTNKDGTRKWKHSIKTEEV
jgi:hypothetical protein